MSHPFFTFFTCFTFPAPTPTPKNQNTIKVKITLGSRKNNIFYSLVWEGVGLGAGQKPSTVFRIRIHSNPNLITNQDPSKTDPIPYKYGTDQDSQYCLLCYSSKSVTHTGNQKKTTFCPKQIQCSATNVHYLILRQICSYNRYLFDDF